MLEEIIRMVHKGGILSFDKISATMDGNPDITRAVIEDLVRRNYLKQTDFSHGGNSRRGCKKCSDCRARSQEIRAWCLTKKAESLLAGKEI